MAVIDVRSDSPSFGHVIKSVPVGSRGNEPHHMDYTLRGNGQLWASGLLTGRTFIFDISHPPDIKLLKVNEPEPERVHTPPHSFALLPNGHTLATAMDMRAHDTSSQASQTGHVGDPAPGGLLEFDTEGNFLRQISAQDPRAGATQISPYALVVKPDIDRILTTNEGHGYLPTSTQFTPGDSVQVWRLSDLRLLRTVLLPPGPRGKENQGPFEPRFAHAPGSRTVFVNCDSGDGLYVSLDLISPDPVFHLVYDFGERSAVGVPALTRDDRFYLQPLRLANKLVVLDVRNPLQPNPVSELRFDRDPANPTKPRQGGPHYLTLDLNERRIAVSDYTIHVPTMHLEGDRRVYLLQFDPQTGAVEFDLSFRNEFSGAVGVDFNREIWPHGKTGAARPHGMIFLP
jgi:hypothetical protein